jgi:hypothetical protein
MKPKGLAVEQELGCNHKKARLTWSSRLVDWIRARCLIPIIVGDSENFIRLSLRVASQN